MTRGRVRDRALDGGLVFGVVGALGFVVGLVVSLRLDRDEAPTDAEQKCGERHHPRWAAHHSTPGEFTRMSSTARASSASGCIAWMRAIASRPAAV